MNSLLATAQANGATYTASASSCNTEKSSPDKALELDRESWNAGNEINPWWKITFSKPVLIDHYRVVKKANMNNVPKVWNVEASNDDKTWKVVDIRDDELMVTDKTYELQTPAHCKYFRFKFLECHGRNSKEGQFAYINFFDFFGIYLPYRTPFMTPSMSVAKTVKKENYTFIKFIRSVILVGLLLCN